MQMEGINYDIKWGAFERGTSLFFPCLDIEQAKEKVIATTKRIKAKVFIRVVIEDGIRGLRIWRM